MKFLDLGDLFPIFKASSIVSGIFSPVVSGNEIAHTPAMTATDPKIVIGNGFHILSNGAITNAMIPPTLAIVLQLPTAVPLRDVG